MKSTKVKALLTALCVVTMLNVGVVVQNIAVTAGSTYACMIDPPTV